MYFQLFEEGICTVSFVGKTLCFRLLEPLSFYFHLECFVLHFRSLQVQEEKVFSTTLRVILILFLHVVKVHVSLNYYIKIYYIKENLMTSFFFISSDRYHSIQGQKIRLLSVTYFNCINIHPYISKLKLKPFIILFPFVTLLTKSSPMITLILSQSVL